MKKSDFSLHPKAGFCRESGFTLIELLIILTILVAVAFTVTSVFTGVDQDARAQVTRAEMDEVAQAIRQFRQDTGYYPKDGPFDHEDQGGQVDLAVADPDPAALLDRFNSPANLSQLYVQPTNNAAPPDAACTNCVLPWNIDTGRGWRGPYLKRENRVDVGDDLEVNGDDDPAIVETAPILNLLGVADPQEFSPLNAAGAFCDGDEAPVETPANTNCILDWRPITDDGDADDNDGDRAFLTHGRPYLYFINPAAVGNVTGCLSVPCLLAFGSNGSYNQGGVDDIVVSVN